MFAIIFRFLGFGLIKRIFGFLLPFIKDPKKLIILILVLIGLFFVYKYNHMKNEIINLHEQNQILITKINKYIESEKELHYQINKQNESIESLKKQSEESKQRIEIAREQADKLHLEYDREIAKISIKRQRQKPR